MLEIDPTDENAFPHKEITEAIIGSAFEVYNQLGYGFLERVYQRALQVGLVRRVTVEIEKRIQVQYKGVMVGDYDVDLVVMIVLRQRSKLRRNMTSEMNSAA